MKETVIKKIEQVVVTSYTCDICGRQIDDETGNGCEIQEMIHIDKRCGYTSVFGDMSHIELDICQHCLKEKLGQFIKVTTWPEWS